MSAATSGTVLASPRISLRSSGLRLLQLTGFALRSTHPKLSIPQPPCTMIVFRVAETKHDHGWCVAVRTLVFAVEQHIDITLEVDQHEDACRHILGFDDLVPFAAARWRRYKTGVAKIERVALLKAWRGRNLGIALVEAGVADIKNARPGADTLRLEAQDYTIPFYRKIGFAVVGEGFLDANIPHHAMERSLVCGTD